MKFKRKLGSVLVSLGIFSSFWGILYAEASPPVEEAVVLTQDMGQQIIHERLLRNRNNSDNDALSMYHYSHRSHVSHYSHRSHTSHYSSYK